MNLFELQKLGYDIRHPEIICDETNNTPEIIDKGEVVVEIKFKKFDSRIFSMSIPVGNILDKAKEKGQL